MEVLFNCLLKVASKELPNVPKSGTLEKAKSRNMGEGDESSKGEKAKMKSSAQKDSRATKPQPTESAQLPLVSIPTSRKQANILSESSESSAGDELLRGMKRNPLSTLSPCPLVANF
jgi:hypothetical protein